MLLALLLSVGSGLVAKGRLDKSLEVVKVAGGSALGALVASLSPVALIVLVLTSSSLASKIGLLRGSTIVLLVGGFINIARAMSLHAGRNHLLHLLYIHVTDTSESLGLLNERVATATQQVPLVMHHFIRLLGNHLEDNISATPLAVMVIKEDKTNLPCHWLMPWLDEFVGREC